MTLTGDQWTPDPVAGYLPPRGVGAHSHETGDVPAGVPVGAVTAYFGTSAPAGWLLCNGAAIPAQYTALIALVGPNTPNLKGRVIVGYDAADTQFDALGETGGAKTHTLTQTEMPSHDHEDAGHTHYHMHPAGDVTFASGFTEPGNHAHAFTTDTWTGSHDDLVGWVGGGGDRVLNSGSNVRGGFSADHSHMGTTAGVNAPLNHNHNTDHDHGMLHDATVGIANLNALGGSGSHNNLQPYLTLSYIIKAAA